jgi:hypothetical protein
MASEEFAAAGIESGGDEPTRDPAMLRASGTAACVRASSPRPACAEGGSVSLGRSPGWISDARIVSSAAASMSSPFLTIALPMADASSRPVA